MVYQLGPGQVKTEYWVVPTRSPARLATVRMTPGSGLAAQPVSIQYVNSALATKADDSSVVHLNGSETISGSKTFASAPSVPAPSSAGQIANKAYVDQAVSNVGAGSYLSTAGGTMTGRSRCREMGRMRSRRCCRRMIRQVGRMGRVSKSTLSCG